MTSPYMTAQEAADFWRFPSVDALRMWANRRIKNIPGLVKKRGRALLFDKQKMEAAMERRTQQGCAK